MKSILQKMFSFWERMRRTPRKAAILSLALKKDLAAASRKLEDLRDPYANYNKMSTKEFSAKVPELNWKT